MKKLIIISGANRGLGKAFFDLFIHQNKEDIVVSLSRTLSDDQQELIKKSIPNFFFIKLNLATMQDCSDLLFLHQYDEIVEKIIFINNAGVIDPIGLVGTFEDKQLLNSINVNVVAPVLIINYIVKTFSGKQVDIVNISSGAATKVVNGWAPYCSGKAYLHMFINAIDAEYKENVLVNVHNINPGVIDTAMQQNIRESSVEGFLRHADFVSMKTEGKLQDAATVAGSIISELNLFD